MVQGRNIDIWKGLIHCVVVLKIIRMAVLKLSVYTQEEEEKTPKKKKKKHKKSSDNSSD